MPDRDKLLNPFVGYQTATLPQDFCMILIEYISDPDQPLEMAQSLRLVLTRDQASEFALALSRISEVPHIPKPPTDSRH